MKILIVGDIFSKLGRATFEENIKRIKEEEKINFVIVNGENASHGKGLNEGHYKWLMEKGATVVTLGNHSFQNRSILNVIDEANNLIRPCNYKEGTPGKGYTTVNYNNLKVTVIQAIGKVFMDPNVEDPFSSVQKVLDETDSDVYICDFHAEATSEKVAFGYIFDGKIQVIFGTHTHVQTNDGRILENGSAYITDLGMTGPLDGVIGVERSIIINRYLNNGQEKFAPQDTGKKQFCGMIVEINEITKKVTNMKVLNIIS